VHARTHARTRQPVTERGEGGQQAQAAVVQHGTDRRKTWRCCTVQCCCGHRSHHIPVVPDLGMPMPCATYRTWVALRTESESRARADGGKWDGRKGVAAAAGRCQRIPRRRAPAAATQPNPTLSGRFGFPEWHLPVPGLSIYLPGMQAGVCLCGASVHVLVLLLSSIDQL